MFYCYMNDEIVNQSSLFFLDHKMWFMIYLPAHITCVSTYCSTYWFTGRPQIVVDPPRNIMCHVYLYASLLVDHDLWSTLHALYVTMIICTYVIW